MSEKQKTLIKKIKDLERFSMSINQKNQYFNIFILPNLINIFNRALIKILASYFVENHKLDPDVYKEWQRIQNN